MSTGAYLAKQYLSNFFVTKLAKAALLEFPRQSDAKSNLSKLGQDINPFLDKFIEDKSLATSGLKALRWTTLGYHHNWDSREYGNKDDSRGTVPELLKTLAEEISKSFRITPMLNAEASICNYYPANIGTIGIHSDDSEYCHHPIVSVSLGLPAVFLLGQGTRDDPCHEILLGELVKNDVLSLFKSMGIY